MKELEIADMIARKILPGVPLNEEEERALAAWREASAGNEACYREIATSLARGEYAGIAGSYPVEEERARLQREIARRAQRSWTRRAAVVAASVAALVAGGYFWLGTPGGEEAAVVASREAGAITPGSSRAELITGDGRGVTLGDDDVQVLLSAGGVEARDAGHTLAYAVADGEDAGESPVEYNTLRTPAGGEYRLLLSDGTLVHLNAATEIRYPVTFAGETREVELSGEAYFEVARDPSRPFIARAGGMTLRVLGTSFNARAYAGRPGMAVTLEEGSLEVSDGGESLVLTPGLQAARDGATGRLSARRVNTRLYTSWKDGYYQFEETPLEEIMEAVSSWYGTRVGYAGEAARRITFSGRLSRYSELGELLWMFDETKEVEFIVSGREITVKKR